MAEQKETGGLFLLFDLGFNEASRRFEPNMDAKVQLGKKIEMI